MKARRRPFTAKVLRGLEIMERLATADMQVDRSSEAPHYSAKQERDFYAAVAWIRSKGHPPPERKR